MFINNHNNQYPALWAISVIYYVKDACIVLYFRILQEISVIFHEIRILLAIGNKTIHLQLYKCTYMCTNIHLEWKVFILINLI